MDLTEFRASFLKTADVRAASELNFRHTAFVEYASELLADAGEISDVEVSFYRGSGSKGRSTGIDAYAFDDADSSLRVVIAEPTYAEVVTTLTQTDAKTLLSRVSTFVEDSVSGKALAAIESSLPAWALANDINRRHDELSRIRIYLVTDKLLSSKMPDWPEGAIGQLPVEAHIWDISRFYRMAQSVAGRDELVIDFGERVRGGLPCLPATEGNGEYQAYLLAVPGSLLADIYDEYGSRLLEGNVRSFLTTRPAVNKGIRNTAVNQPWMFFAYNNGIAATASEVEIETTPTGPRLLSAKDLQIVNGGQTTASLATARRTEKKSLEGVFVPMKLSVVSPERSAEMVPNIAKFANSQNKVSEADFFSNHEFHRRLEGFSRRLWAPAKAGSQHETHWFYERARGQYANEQARLTPAKKREFLEANPRDQLIVKTDLAKSEMAWRGVPHIVSLGAQKNFMKFADIVAGTWGDDGLQYNEGYFKAAVVRVLMFRATEKLVSAQRWYEGGYRANVVAYSMAKLAHMVDHAGSGLTLDLEAIWKKQALPDVVAHQIAVIAKAMHEVITAPPSHVSNVTEWAKRVPCWDAAKEVRVELVPGMMAALVSKSAVLAAAATEKKQQKQDSGIEAQMRVLQLGPEYWSRLRTWATTKSLLLPDEDGMLRVASGAAGGFPTEWQSVRLLTLKERMQGEGFPSPDAH
jgi:hypothetical protein